MGSPGSFHVNYSTLDRLFHRIAFGAPSIQLTAADLEALIWGASYRRVEAARPIFITSLPRAGTTIMLEVLSHFPSLATHVYRDMPFVLAPVFWSHVSTPFRKKAAMTQRAHGDGLQVGYDSPEAFEEVFWQTFWPEKYAETRIALWEAADSKEDARVFFVDHIKKLIALRRPDRVRDGRYISKNNNNIARLDLIGTMFPDARILVPVRRPVAHAASLLRQHHNFRELHEHEPFSRRYMADLGHYEFGDLHKPIAFPGLDMLISNRNSLQIDYWLGYWIAAFEYVLARRHTVVPVSYEATCADPHHALAGICTQLEIAEEGMLDKASAFVRKTSLSQDPEADVDPELRDRAEELYLALIAG